jgi:putative transcriptional regulator
MKIDFDFFKINQKIAPKKGRIIISEPFLNGELFSRSAVLLVEYSSEGAVGFILNKPFESDLNDLFSMPLGYNPELFTGGPVSPDNLFYVHTLGSQLEGSIQIKDRLSWGGDFDQLKFALVTGTVKPEQVKFFVGYSGWSAGQLEQEIAENSWLVVESDTYQIMNSNRNFWLESVKSAGGHYETWQNFPVDPNAN